MQFIYVALMAMGLAVCSEAGDMKLFDAALADCFKEQKLSADEMELVKSHKHLEKEFSAVPKTIQCLPLCIHKKLGFIDADNKVMEKATTDGLTQFFNGDQGKAAAKLEKCQNPKGDNQCEKSFNFEACVHMP